jgi:hypothetical protein
MPVLHAMSHNIGSLNQEVLNHDHGPLIIILQLLLTRLESFFSY